MGLIQELGIEVAKPRWFHRWVAAVASSRPGAWLMSKVIHRVDGSLHRRSGGKITLSGMAVGLPTVMISTTGAKSGLTRMSPLTAIPIAEGIGLVGTNFGGATTPGWVYNLQANPVGSASKGDRTAAFVARPATASEREEILATAGDIYSGYDKYRDRARNRHVSVFVLDFLRAS